MYRRTDFSWRRLTLESSSRSRYVTTTPISPLIGSSIVLRSLTQICQTSPTCSTVNDGWRKRKMTANWNDLSTSRSPVVVVVISSVARNVDWGGSTPSPPFSFSSLFPSPFFLLFFSFFYKQYS